MASLLTKVKSKMSIYAHRKSRGLLEGEYCSVFKGRSMDFDDLREYVVGDDVKDIDWKATARSGQTLIRRYIAVRKHNIMLVVDTGKNMSALTPSLDNKTDVSILSAGVLGYLAQKHGDLVSLLAGDDEHAHYIPLSGRNSELEQMLRYVQEHTNLHSPRSNMSNLLNFIVRNFTRRMILVIVTDSDHIDDERAELLRRLRAQHEILYVHVDDFDPTNKEHLNSDIYDVEDPVLLETYIRKNKKLGQQAQEAYTQRAKDNTNTLKRLGINCVHISSERDVIPKIFFLLEKQRHVR